KIEDSRPIIDARFQDQELDENQWNTLGKAKLKNGSLLLQDDGDATNVPYLITKQEFAPNSAPLTIVADIRFTDIGPNRAPTFAVLTRSANERDIGVNSARQTMRTCARCSFKSEPDSASATIEVATKLDPYCPLTNNQWRGFDQMQENVP